MLFGIDFCRRRTRVRKRRPPYLNYGGIAALLLAALVFTALLFLAPQWLLVVLVILLTALVMALVLLPEARSR